MRHTDLLLLVAAAPLMAQDPSAQEPKPYNPPPLFEAQTPVEFTLTGAFSKIKKEKTGDANYYPGTVSYKSDTGIVWVTETQEATA